MSYIAERRQEEKDRRRVEIVEAAEDLYRELGWDAVTMDSVARRARLSRALVYVYFKDKQDLHFAIAARALDMLRQRFEEASARARTGVDKVEACGRAYMAYAQEFPHFFDACAQLESHAVDGSEPSPQVQPCVELGKKVHDIVVEALASGQRDGSIRADLGDLQVISRVLWGFMHGLIQIAITKGEPLAQQGISVQQLSQQAVWMIRQALTCGLKK
ncbi:MAG TPA: TetR/AcrR family transcriptional regulator [Steroidobacteraceae bacterium]|nr:TetR/AcrR family transcriptional regulator [Steroidobacteraceae bacterium]